MKYKAQVNKEHYSNNKYLQLDRWVSYYYQIESISSLAAEIQKSNKKTAILEIGSGDGTVSTILRKNGYKLTTMDIAKDLNPDILSGLPEIPIKTRIDIILCCEVLEHIKYEDVEVSLKNMSKKSNFLVLSVPHKSFYLSI